MAADTIAAIATPAGRGGVGIVRVSGPRAGAIGAAIVGRRLPPRRALHARFLDADGVAIDDGLVLAFVAPASYTGEDVVELQGHGGPAVLAMVLDRALELGARMARPGEFTERAFLNDRISLSQAEAVADLIDASTRAAVRAAVRSLAGEFAVRVDAIASELLGLRVQVEAAIDFPDEDIDLVAAPELGRHLDRVRTDLELLIAATEKGVRLREGVAVALAGRPNAGKSTLFNRLLGADRAIVTDQPGTTRDTLHGSFSAHGLAVELTDTAGLRNDADVVEREGIRRAREAIGRADLALLLIDVRELAAAAERALDFDPETSVPELNARPDADDVLIVPTKIDLLEDGDRALAAIVAHVSAAGYRVCPVSSTLGSGIDALLDAIVAAAGVNPQTETPFSARQRHLDALRRARTALVRGIGQRRDTGSGELLADDLRVAHAALGEIGGAVSADALLGEIFASFCIGK